MAEAQTVPKKPATKKKPAPKYASADEVKELGKSVDSIVDTLKDLASMIRANKEETKVETKEEKAISEAVYDQAPVNPAWIAKAKEIVGEALERCEVLYPKHGGVLFTLVIKKEFSNAPQEYLDRYKADRRTKEIGNEGIEGVENWCKQVAGNLKRSR